jgi:O-succinylbenzoate synthase
MIIKTIELYHVAMKLREEFTTSFGSQSFRHSIIVKVEDKNGEAGWGEVVADQGPWYSYETVETAWHIIRDFIAPSVINKELDISRYIDTVSRIRGHNMAKAGIEYALWDLKCKIEGIPLYKALGGVRDRVTVGVSIGIQKSIDLLINKISEYLDQGYRRIKIKIKPGWDVEVIKSIRKTFPNILLQADANAAYTLNELKILMELDKYELLMLEQPLHYDDLILHAFLQRRLRTPICLDESIKSVRDVVAAYKLGSCSIINVKPGRVGGLVETKKIHDYTAETGIPIWIGGMLETGIGRAFLIAAATLPNIKYPSDISASSRYWEEDVVEPEWTLNPDGTITAPNKPGIGVEILENKIKRFTVKKIKIQ